MNPDLSPPDSERLIEEEQKVVADAEKEAEEERERQRELERKQLEERARLEREQAVARLRERHQSAVYAPGMSSQQVDEIAARRAEHKGGFPTKLLMFILVLGLLAGSAYLVVTPNGNDFLDRAMNPFRSWTNDGGNPAGSTDDGGSSSPGGSLPAAAPDTPTPTATSTSTPVPATAAPTPTPIPVSPWAGFLITADTQGKEVLDKLSDEEVACLQSANPAYLEYFETLPLGVLISTNPPVRDASDMPELAGCLSEDSTQHLNQAIAIFHDPTLAPPTPKPTVKPEPTPKPTARPEPTPRPTEVPKPTVEPEPTPKPTATPVESRTDRLRKLALDLVNKDRADHGLPPVSLGSNRAAQLHADDLLRNDHYGHWWADGRKPYMVYTQTGGKSYASENVAMSGWLNNRWEQAGCNSPLLRCIVPTPERAIRDHQWSMMYDDAHADWGHRDNILRETHRAVNIGIAWNNRRVVFVQHFEGGAVTADAPPSLDENGVLRLSVTKNETGIRIGGLVSIYYDPPPIPVSRQLNESLDSYCIGGGSTTNCPDSAIRILDPPQQGWSYPNLDNNEVVASSWTETANSFSFSADVGRLMERPGVYTVTLWRDDGGNYYSKSLVQLSVFVE